MKSPINIQELAREFCAKQNFQPVSLIESAMLVAANEVMKNISHELTNLLSDLRMARIKSNLPQ